MPTGRLYKLLPTISAWFDQRKPAVYTEEDLTQLLEETRQSWQIPRYINGWRFVDFLLKNTPLKELRVQSVGERNERDIVRYSWNSINPYLLGVSLRKRAYLTHSTAMLLHGLTDQLPQTLFVTTQQRVLRSRGQLTQKGIDQAFAKKQRESNLLYKAFDYRYVLLEGTFITPDEIVGTKLSEGPAVIWTSTKERTLLDICVRPSYSGGVFQILEAFRRARGIIDTRKLFSILERHSFAYPYQQAIGFFLEKAGFPNDDISIFRNTISPFDFYLSYGLIEKTYVPAWRLYVPKGLE